MPELFQRASPVASSAANSAASPVSRLRLRHLLNIPNILTLSRLAAIPVLLAFLSKGRYTYGLYVFALAAITDSLDGTVARWFNAKTEIGAFLDPFADKLMLLSTFIVLTLQEAIPGWLLGVLIIRDVVIVAGYFMISFFASMRIPVRPTYFGKACTFLQIFCIIGALSRFTQRFPGHVFYWQGLLYLTLIITALSGVQYAYRGLAILATNEPDMFK
jgi:cardiolipin synthase (CMP-forming)